MKALLAVLVGSILTAPVQAQDLTPASERVQAYSLQANSFIDALLKIATRFQLPLAVEWVKSADTLRPVRLNLREPSATAMLDAIVSAHGDYGWQFENGVVHVFQKAIVNDSRNPLNVVIERFPNDSWTVNFADTYLFHTVREVVSPTGQTGIVFSVLGSPGEPQFQFGAENAPVREILNKIITASKMKIWIATFPNNSSLTVKGFWEGTPMYDPKYVALEDQPFWIFLRWGDIPWKRLETQEP